MTNQAVLERARELHEEARTFKAAVWRNKRRLKQKMAELEAFCGEHGIQLNLIDTDPGRSKPNEHHGST